MAADWRDQMPENCDNCGAKFDLVDQGEADGIGYVFQRCPNCGRYGLVLEQEKLEGDMIFEVAAKEPFPNGTWVRLKKS